jgi:glycosyltransferase involved in cell wall biosynthesis
MSNVRSDITFVIFTFNEEQRIERVILNFVRFGRVLLVDNESTDRTLEIAMQYGCDVLINKNAGWVEDELTTARVKAAVQSEWIYWGFADEMVGAETMDAILFAVNSGKCDIVNIARKNYYYGEFCHDAFAARTNRVFRKDSIDFTGNKIHLFGRVDPKARIHELPLEHYVHHFISNTAKSYLHAMDGYTDVESTEDRPVLSMVRLILSGGKMIVGNLLFRRGYQAGTPGYFLVAQMVYYQWLSAMKLYEKQALLDRGAIELKNDVFRDQILQSLR